METMSLSTSERMVATRLGVPLEEIAAMKRNPIVGKALHGTDNSGKPYPPGPADGPPGSKPFLRSRQPSPFPDAPKKFDAAPGGGRTTKPRTMVEPENSDAEDVRDPAGIIGRPMRVIFPNRAYADGK